MSHITKIVSIVMFLFLFCEMAYSADIFTVDGIKVSSNGKTANQAKDIAVLNGQREAFVKLVERVSSNPPSSELSNINSEKLSELVQGMEVNDEKVASNYYSATLNITFNKTLVENLLKENKTATDKKVSAMVLVPFLLADGKSMLFEETNPLRNSLANVAKSSHVLSITVPVNLRGVDKSKLNLNIEGLSQEVRGSLLKLGQNYKSDNVVLIVVNKTEGNNFNIRMQNVGDKNAAIKEISFAGADIGSEELFNQVAKNIITALENQWSNTKVESSEPATKISVTVPIDSIVEWSLIQKKLLQLDFLKAINVKSLSVQEVLLDLSFNDSFENLSKKMSENGFWLEKSQDKITLKSNNNINSIENQGEYISSEGSTNGEQK